MPHELDTFRKMTATRIVGLAIVAWSAFQASPAGAADAENGKRLAERWCAACHLISSEQKSSSTEAPPFSVIANKPDFCTQALAYFLLQPHPKMPDFGLSRDSTADLAAFIASQR